MSPVKEPSFEERSTRATMRDLSATIEKDGGGQLVIGAMNAKDEFIQLREALFTEITTAISTAGKTFSGKEYVYSNPLLKEIPAGQMNTDEIDIQWILCEPDMNPRDLVAILDASERESRLWHVSGHLRVVIMSGKALHASAASLNALCRTNPAYFLMTKEYLDSPTPRRSEIKKD